MGRHLSLPCAVRVFAGIILKLGISVGGLD